MQRVAIHVAGPGADAGASVVFALAMAQTDAQIGVERSGDAVTISRVVPTGPLDPPAEGSAGLVALRLVQGARAAQPPALFPGPAPGPAPAPAPALVPVTAVTQNPAAGEAQAKRTELIARLGEADQAVAALSASLTGVARALAETQLQDASAGADVPARGLLAQLQARRIDLAARYRADYPGIAIADDEIGQLRGLVDQETAGRPRPAAAIATLRAEQQRLTAELNQERRRRDDVEAGLAMADATPAPMAVPTAGLGRVGAESIDAPPLTYGIEDLGGTTAADPRLAGYAVILAVGALVWWRLGRARPKGFAQHVTRLEQATRLPVLRCLDVQAMPLAPLDGYRLEAPAAARGRPPGRAQPQIYS